jgi:acyl-CoA reductase-like NAD-dependent aldehyde dehydrogenase
MSASAEKSGPGLLIGGERRPARSGRFSAVLDPATNRPITTVPSGGKDDVDDAVEAARKAFESPDWRGMDPAKRGRILLAIGQQVRDHADELARIESQNVGKPLKEAKVDISFVSRGFEYFAGLADKIQGYTIPVPGARFDYTLREPLGVTAHIAPWNYPLLLACRGIAPALAAGNTVVLKPATLTPLSSLRFGELVAAAGLPPGVLNVVTGPGREVGEALARHPGVDSVTFTGSTETGKELLKAVADRVVPATMELGGKNTQIVLPDARLDRALTGILYGAFQNSGQMCWAGSRVVVHEEVAPTLLAKLKEKAASLRLGPGLNEGTQMGPLVSRDHMQNVLSAIEEGRSAGAKLLTGGGPAEEPELREGNFVRPTIFEDPPEAARVAREEVFGPVLTVWDFKDIDEAITRANDTPYGLSAGLWTQNVGKAHTIARRLQTGMVSVNEYPVTFPQVPFLGWKQSGLGQEQGLDAILFYTHVKNVLVNLE